MPVKKLDVNKVISYAYRRLNPFLGVMQVIESQGGRAHSTNGIVWDIEVIAEQPDNWGSLNTSQNNIAFYRFGLWSLKDGLVSRPLAPHLENDPLSEQCNFLIECIKQRLCNLPFKLIDTEELWLFDEKNHKPLVLLASVIPGKIRPSPEPKSWSSHIGAEGVPSQYKFSEARQLMAQIKKAASFNIKKHWVIRQEDGSGIDDLNKQHMFENEFPPFLVSESWLDKEESNRVRNYIHWIAPSLLTLQKLSKQQRLRLEKNLNVQAISIEHHKELYTEVINEKCLNSAIVQCKLQKSNL